LRVSPEKRFVAGSGGDTGETRLREMRLDDLPRVQQIEEESYSTPWTLATFHGLFGRSDAELLVAEAQGLVVGYAVSWIVADRAELGNIAVAAGWRRRGIAASLLEAVLEQARLRPGVRELFLEVRVSNTGAQTLYRKYGFGTVGRWRDYYTFPVEDALVMLKHIKD